ncbi:MAG TPA: cytochrome c oxidase subunit 3 [Chitinophagales bacterium]|nr:cytochrome c oxidase subunit 3 [Chitinophagales bacterium]
MELIMSAAAKEDENSAGMRIHPLRFALWAGIACLIMMFAALTSAYIVRKAAGNWVEFKLPFNFIISAAIMLLSSLSMHGAYLSFKHDKLNPYRIALATTLLLSLAFLYSQYLGWQKLKEYGIYLSGNPSGSFVYVISYLHFAHVAGGVVFIIIAFIKSIVVFANPANFLIYRTDSNKSIRIELLATYWHFVDVLWLYLLVFFMVS